MVGQRKGNGIQPGRIFLVGATVAAAARQVELRSS